MKTIETLIVYTVLLMSRISQVSRCLSAVVNLKETLEQLGRRRSGGGGGGGGGGHGMANSLWLTSRAIGGMLTTRRHYMDPIDDDNDDNRDNRDNRDNKDNKDDKDDKKDNDCFQYDPRMLVFEFAHCLVLRRSQVSQVRLFSESDAIVHQMVSATTAATAAVTRFRQSLNQAKPG